MVNPDKVAFTIFGQPVYWYGILMAAGILLAVLLAMREAKRKKMHADTVLDLCLILIPCGVIGARLYYVLFSLDQYLADPVRILYIWEGGLAIYGAIIGGIIGLYIYARRKKIRFLKLADIIAPGLVLAQAIGRWGNFFNQEAYGLPVTNPGLLWFPFAVRIDGTHMFDYGHGAGAEICPYPYHLATFFYEAMWCLLIFAFLWFFLRKRTKHSGDMFFAYVLLYSFGRMFIEGLRGDSLWLIPDVIRVSQLLSFLLFLGVLVFLLVRRGREKKLGVLIWPSPEPEVGEAQPIESAGNDAQQDKADGAFAAAPDEKAEAEGQNHEKDEEE